jgi:serine/threonine-protein kinase
VGRDFVVGDVVDRRYALRREIDRGGIGAVFEAEHLVTTRMVALKLLRDDFLGNPEATRRLLREAKALTLARHPNVVAALDAGTAEGGGPYLAMELVEGRTLAGILTTKGRIDATDAVLVGVQLCDAMAFAHARGVVHRDIKPSNLFVAKSERGTETVKLYDFGVAALRGDAVSPNEAKITQQGSVVGTPEYMAPEQLLGKAEVDHRADQYAIAATLYECLSGHAPYEGTYGEILLAAQTRRPAPLAERCPELPAALPLVIERALSKEPEARFPGVRELASALLDAGRPARGFTSLLGIRRDAPPPLPRSPQPEAAPVAPRGRRKHARAPYVTPVRVLRADGGSVDGRSEDISEGGMLVIAERPCQNGESVQIRFALPISGRIVTLNAVARWVRMARGTGALGLELAEPPADACREIADYVTAMGGEL